MPPTANIRKACLAMKKLGYKEKTVRPVLKRLLALYENNWLLIEDDGYLVLTEALLDSQKEVAQKDELEKVNYLSGDDVEENEPPLKRSKRNSMAKSTHSHGNSSSSLSPKETEQTEELRSISDAENDEYNHPIPLAHLEKSKDEFNPEKRMITYERGKHKVFSKERDDDLALETNVSETEPLSYDLVEFGVPLAVIPPVSPRLLSKGNSHENYSNAEENRSTIPEVIDLDADDTYTDSPLLLENASYMEGNHSECMDYELSEAEKSQSKAKESMKLDIASSSRGDVEICLMVKSSSKLGFDVPNLDEVLKQVEAQCLKSYGIIPQNGFSMLRLMKDMYTDPPLLLENASYMEGNHSEYMDYELSEVEKNENKAQESMKLNIASSSRGDVEICLMVKSSSRSDFDVPNLDEVLKQVEAQCLKSYGIIPPHGFSMLRLMKDMRECILAKGTTSNVGPTNILSSLPISNGHQINGPFRFQNLFKVSTDIPRSIRSFHLDLSRCKIYWNKMDKHGSSSSSNTMTVQNQHYYNNYIEDITKGHEDYEICSINELNNDPFPKMKYISRNVTYQSANTRFLLSRISENDCCSRCFGDCLAAEVTCGCAGKTGGEFTYTPCGLVKESFIDNCISMKNARKQDNFYYCQNCPLLFSTDESLSGKCKGHLIRPFIKECWYKCGCKITCGNRVVQRGITVQLQVFMTPDGKGWGLRTLEEIPKGTFVCEYVGEVVTIKELFERKVQKSGDSQTYPVLLDANWNGESGLKDEETLCLDATLYGNVARFINHRCFDANLVDIPVELESPDRHYYHVAFFTTRKVEAMEELTSDYGIEFNDDHSVKAFECQCGSEFCRDHKATKRSRSDV